MNANIAQMEDRRSEVRPIKLTDTTDGTVYTLEYNKRTVLEVNELGFDVTKLQANIQKMLPLLWYGAFLMHHKKSVSQKKAENLLYNMGGLSESVLSRLADLYSAPTEGLLVTDEEAEENSKNATVVVEL